MTQVWTDMLFEIFSAQEEDLETEIKPTTFWRDVIRGGNAMNQDEQALLLSSPLNRRMYHEAYKAERREMFSRAANFTHAPRFREAASGSGRQPLHIDGLQGVELIIRPLGGDGWHVTLDLSDCASVPGARVTIHDDRGRIWMEETLPADGIIYAKWPFGSTPQDFLVQVQAIGIRVDGYSLIPLTDFDRGLSDD